MAFSLFMPPTFISAALWWASPPGSRSYPRLAAASRDAFAALVDQAIAHQVAFVIVAGDIYDGEWRDTSIGLFFNRQVSRLIREGIRVWTIRGNPDAASVVTKSVRLPQGVFEFSSRSAETVLLDD